MIFSTDCCALQLAVIKRRKMKSKVLIKKIEDDVMLLFKPILVFIFTPAEQA
jgi:hypothetical protein